MEDNPYSAFVDLMRDESKHMQTASWRIGSVTSGNPLTVDIGGAPQDSSAIVMLSLITQVSVTVNEAEGHTHAATTKVTQPAYMRGDMLLLIPIEDEQRYIVIGKLVGL